MVVPKSLPKETLGMVSIEIPGSTKREAGWTGTCFAIIVPLMAATAAAFIINASHEESLEGRVDRESKCQGLVSAEAKGSLIHEEAVEVEMLALTVFLDESVGNGDGSIVGIDLVELLPAFRTDTFKKGRANVPSVAYEFRGLARLVEDFVRDDINEGFLGHLDVVLAGFLFL